MRIRSALATVAVLAVTAGSLTACGDTGGSAASSSSSSCLASSSSKEASGDSGGHLDEETLVDAISTGPLEAGSAHMTMTMDGAMALTAEGDVAYQDSGPEMSMRMNMPQMGSGKMELGSSTASST